MHLKFLLRAHREFKCSVCSTTSGPQRKCSASAYGRSTTCLAEGRFDFAASETASSFLMLSLSDLLTATIPSRLLASDQLLKCIEFMSGCKMSIPGCHRYRFVTH